MYANFFKRILDIIAALVGLTLLSPIFIITFLALLFINKGKPFFLQSRPGKDEKLFKVIKFKSMTDAKDASGELLPFEDRLTPTGNFIRKNSIDEIPQLINVLIGNMSLVGPRPLLIQYLPLYNAEQRRRHSVKPGITGWAQVKGRNAISWDDKFKYDIWYVDHMSFYTDIKIILLTIKKVLLKEDVNSADNLNMPYFEGNAGEQNLVTEK